VALFDIDELKTDVACQPGRLDVEVRQAVEFCVRQ
jgi:hypothetical protein